MLNFFKGKARLPNRLGGNTSGRLEEVSLIYLPNTILLPTMMLPLYVDDKRNRLLIDHSLKEKSPVGICNINIRNSSPEQLVGKTIGIGNAKLLQRHSQQKKNIIVIGTDRFLIKKVIQEIPYVRVSGVRLGYASINPSLEMSLLSEIKILGLQWVKQNYPNRKNVLQYLRNLNNLDEFLNFIASYLLDTQRDRQRILDTTTIVQKFTLVYNQLVSKLDIKTPKAMEQRTNVLKFPGPDRTFES